MIKGHNYKYPLFADIFLKTQEAYILTLKDLKIGATAVITSVGGSGEGRQHLLDMGVIAGTEVTLVKRAPMGDPLEICIHGYELALRLEDADRINVAKDFKRDMTSVEIPRDRYINHPEKNAVKDGKLTFALAGNQNCGKTTLFNRLTGANRHVGNFPGVTVDKKEGAIKGYPDTLVTDLPGIYSLSPYSSEEIVSRRFIIDEKPDGIINIIDATNIERSLYLTMQLIELDIPMVLALNMMDEIEGNGGAVDAVKLERILGIPAVPISASKNEGLDKLIKRAVHAGESAERPRKSAFVNKYVAEISKVIKERAKAAQIPPRFAASKAAEGDNKVIKALGLSDEESKRIEKIIARMEAEYGLDRAAIIADARYTAIHEICRFVVSKPKERKERIRSRRLDAVLTGKYTAIPTFILIMGLVFYLTFYAVGSRLQEMLELGVDYLTAAADNVLASLGVSSIINSLVTDGIFGGVGSVVSFVPAIVTLFFFLSLLEDSGYMARVAFVADKPLRKIGLSGKSIVPLLTGFGCSVPAIMSSRALSSDRDRKLTIFLTPFMSCSAKLPVYAFFTAAFFPKRGALVMIGLYLFGIAAGIGAAQILRKTMFRGNSTPFVMELPDYRMPSAGNVARFMRDKASDFLHRAFTVIFLASIVVWFLQTFDFRMNIAVNPSMSILAAVAGLIAPIFIPLGFGEWRISTALITGFMAKESVVSTLSVLFTDGIEKALSPLSALTLLVFCLLYTPCVAAIAAVKREIGVKWAVYIVIGQCAAAWICAFIARLIFTAIGLT